MNLTVEKTKEDQSVYLYFIDGVLYDQKGFSTEADATSAGRKKIKELSAKKKW